VSTARIAGWPLIITFTAGRSGEPIMGISASSSITQPVEAAEAARAVPDATIPSTIPNRPATPGTACLWRMVRSPPSSYVRPRSQMPKRRIVFVSQY
jgi:hypothetical protein